MALASTGIRVLKGSLDDPVINGELVPPDLQVLLEILKTKFKAMHKILKVIRPELNLIHQKMMTGHGDLCRSIIPFVVVGQTNDLVNFNIQRLGELPTHRADDPLFGSFLIVSPLTTIWFFAFTRW
ncbi:hypothetical protein AMTR_s00044p00188090 [Amborella trichopoda]|uniref:Uncharacterized protein n=1 Tax=Amborella trichopoda TaxID=13333 RepID=U5D4T6_AMBTC|nr:hypothetical protein AMTR_s00044p00188090 [Amborella trichopoda]